MVEVWGRRKEGEREGDVMDRNHIDILTTNRIANSNIS